MEKIVEQGILYDFYGALLTGHQQRIYEQAVYENLSLNEIAEQEGISRQAVHDLLQRSTRQMQRYEDKLGMIGRFRRLREDAETLRRLAESDQDAPELRAGAGALAERILRDLE